MCFSFALHSFKGVGREMRETTAAGNPVPGWDSDRRRDSAAPSGVSINGHGDVHISGSDIAGRDITKNTTTINKHRHFQLGIGLAAIAVVATAAVGIHIATSSSSSQGIVYTAGAPGAKGTIAQMQQAEEAGDASSWCFLASSNDSSTCQALLSNGYSAPDSAAIRGQVADVTISQPSGGGDGYTFSLGYQGHSYPGVPLEWTGQRWQLSPAIYDICLNNGGLFASVVETAKGEGALFGIPFG
jgi:hypothetical protein